MVYAQNINLGASSFLRLVSDSVAAAPPSRWASPAPIVTNFTDFVYFASLSLARSVKVEGYTIFNPGTGTVNPRADQGAIPLRFRTDPATGFLPSVQSGPSSREEDLIVKKKRDGADSFPLYARQTQVQGFATLPYTPRWCDTWPLK